MRSFVLFTVVGLALVVSGECAAQSAETEAAATAELRVGEHYLDASATTQALPELARIVRDYPNTRAAVTAGYRIAYCHAFEGRHEQAVAVAQDVIASHPGTSEAAWCQVLVGMSQAAMGHRDGALEALLRVGKMSIGIADQSAASEARTRIGHIALARGRGHHWSPARMAMLDESKPADCSWALATLAGAAAEQEDFDRASRYYGQLKTEHPSSTRDIAWAAARIGEAGAELRGKIKNPAPETVRMMKDLLLLPRKLAPNDRLLVARAEYHLGRYLTNIERDYEGAVALLSATARDCPDTEFTALVHYQLGTALRRLGRYEDAVAEFRLVATAFPASGYATTSLCDSARSLVMIGRIAEARAILMELLRKRREPDWRLIARHEIGKLLLMEGDLEGAATAYESASRGWLDYEGRAPVNSSSSMREAALGRAAKLAADAESIRRAIAEGGK